MTETGMSERRQFATFYVAKRMYGIDVMRVQEVTREIPLTPVPLAPGFVHGLINLRGQIATAIGLRELFGIPVDPGANPSMNIVCRAGGALFSLLVDQVGDVMELTAAEYEPTPETLAPEVRDYLQGVYKIATDLMSVIEIDKIAAVIGR